MKSKAIAAALFLVITVPVFAQDSLLVGWEYRGQPFAAFAREAEKHFNLRFLYDEQQVTDIITGYYGENPLLFTVLDSLFKNRKIFYYKAPGGNIILTRDYEVRELLSEMPGSQFFIPSESAADIPVKLASGQALLAEIGNPADRNLPGKVEISGYIRDEDTKEPVAGVTVFVPGISAGTLTNSFGFYSLSLPRGSHTLRYTFIGMREMIYDIRIFSSGELNVTMKSVLVPLKGAVITAEKDITLIQPETGVEKVSIANLKLQPTAMGETDVLKSMLMIPGV
nr:carboxypeptidase-like regulatory domain-containing protein [Bacteroidales bacterium]